MIKHAAGIARHAHLRPMPKRRLHRIAGAAFATSFATGSALAADLPVKASQPPAYQWAGCYIGLNAGGAASLTDFSTSVSPGTHLLGGDPAVVAGAGDGSRNFSTFLGGGQAGCNLQSGTLVYGLEGDFDYFRAKSEFDNNTNTLSNGVTPFAVTQSLTTDFLATIRPRIGIAADRNFGYITGGAAFTQANYTQSYLDGATPPGTGIATGSKFLVGWTLGAGWEYAWSDNWNFRVEYLFAKFGGISAAGTIADAAGGTNALQGSGDLIIQTLRAGVNFKF